MRLGVEPVGDDSRAYRSGADADVSVDVEEGPESLPEKSRKWQPRILASKEEQTLYMSKKVNGQRWQWEARESQAVWTRSNFHQVRLHG